MPCYDDAEGVYWTVQCLKAYHDLTDCEILIVDNKGEDKNLRDWASYWSNGLVRYEVSNSVVGTAPAKQKVFELARGDYVICIDCHVLLLPHSLDRLWEGDDLIHGVMAYDDLKSYVTHMTPEWSGEMWGVWAPHVQNLPTEPFEIPMHGGGLFGCRREAWLGFNDKFRGFGGEEGYIHEKYRRMGKRTYCLPFLRWLHRFDRPNGVPYPLTLDSRIRNYLIGFTELGMDIQPIKDHFKDKFPQQRMDELLRSLHIL